jgi:hypothetical protein
MNHAFRSTWGALLWKEWRQQWLTFVVLAGLCLTGYLGYCKSAGGRPDPTGWVLLLILASACLGASVFAAEGDDQTAGFLDRLPLAKWLPLVTKYTVAMTLVVLCVLLPTLLRYPDLDEAFCGTRLTVAWQFLNPWGAVALCVSAIVAVAAAFAGSGLGAMGTLLATGAVAAIGVFLFQTVGVQLSFFTFDQKLGIQAGVFVGWFLPHLWLARTWSRRGTSAKLWRPVCWAVAAVLAPVLCQAGIQVGQRLFLHPARSILLGDATALPSPDGHTVALTAWRSDGPRRGASKTWLMDVDTGRWRRLGPWWRDTRLRAWHDDMSCWSPDGRWVRLHSTSIFTLAGLSDEQWWERIRETIWRVGERGAKPVQAWKHPGFASTRWLGDGTMTVYAPDAWEFRDLDTGTVKRCLHPAKDAPVDGRWHNVPKVWLDREISSIYVDEADDGGQRVCRYWRTAQDLARTERRDISISAALPSGSLYPTPSKDGRWVLLSTAYSGPGSLWLVSLVDGDCRRLNPSRAEVIGRPFFTPDSSLLVVQVERGLRVWGLASGRPELEAGIPLPPLSFCPIDPNDFSGAISPSPPWRVAVALSWSEAVHVVDLKQHTVGNILITTPSPEGQQLRGRQVHWLGEDRLLVEYRQPYRLWVVEADGSGSRQVLP